VHAYVEASQAGDAALFDQVYVVAPVVREDPCAAFAAAIDNVAKP